MLGKIPKQRWSNTAPGANDIAFLPFPCQSTWGPPEPIDHRVAIFRQSPYKGAAHTRLAADFGRLYAKYMGIFYSVVRYGVPSYQPLLGIWSDQLKLSSLQQAGLLAACSGRARPRLTPEWEGLAKKLLDEAVLPEATAFLSGGISSPKSWPPILPMKLSEGCKASDSNRSRNSDTSCADTSRDSPWQEMIVTAQKNRKRNQD